MLFVDSRVGSDHLATPVATLGVPVEVTTLEFGDVAFAGNGPEGATLQVGVELKRLPDLLQSFQSGRLSNHQLPGLVNAYDQVWLIVEGRYRPSATGILEWARENDFRDGATISNWQDAGFGFRRWRYAELEGRLLTLQTKAHVRVYRSNTPDETARFIAALYDWFVNTEYEEHRSHLASPLKTQFGMLRPPTLRERVAAQLPGIGAKRASMVAGMFDSVREMVNADEAQWVKLPGLGKKTAREIVTSLGEAA